jgi:nitrite reductase/ring-hydroxylating ferredoxin subunit
MTLKPICGVDSTPHNLPPGFVVCPLADMPDGRGRMFTFPLENGEFRLLVLRSGETCLGYENRCPHFGIPLAARDEQLIFEPHQSFRCNTHYARFRWTDGYCDYGDCEGESLVPVTLVVRDGLVCLG